MPSRLDPPEAKRPPLQLTISAQCGATHSSFLRRQVKLAHQLLAPPLAELSIALVGDKRMSELHQQFMSIAGPTDVLTFPLEMDANDRVSSGEVVICVPEGRRRAREEGTLLSNELLLYAIHGMLHLSGYDDRTAREFRIMHRTEDDLLNRLGIGPVFEPAKQAAIRTSRKTKSPTRGPRRPS